MVSFAFWQMCFLSLRHEKFGWLQIISILPHSASTFETESYFARARIRFCACPSRKKWGPRGIRGARAARHSLDHLLASYAPSQLRSSSPNRNTNGRAKKKSATSSTATKATNTKTMAAKKPDKPSERTSRRRQPLTPRWRLFLTRKRASGRIY